MAKRLKQSQGNVVTGDRFWDREKEMVTVDIDIPIKDEASKKSKARKKRGKIANKSR